jgi:uncharacterized protein YcfL
MIKTVLVIVSLTVLTGCAATVPDANVSRDQTMESMAKIALINEMLNSPDPVIRARAAEIAERYVTKEKKKNLFGF